MGRYLRLSKQRTTINIKWIIGNSIIFAKWGKKRYQRLIIIET